MYKLAHLEWTNMRTWDIITYNNLRTKMFMMSNSQAFCGAANVGFFPTQRLPPFEKQVTQINESRSLEISTVKYNFKGELVNVYGETCWIVKFTKLTWKKSTTSPLYFLLKAFQRFLRFHIWKTNQLKVHELWWTLKSFIQISTFQNYFFSFRVWLNHRSGKNSKMFFSSLASSNKHVKPCGTMNFNLLIMRNLVNPVNPPPTNKKNQNFIIPKWALCLCPMNLCHPTCLLNGQPTKPVRDGMVLENQWSIQIPGSSAKGTSKTQNYSLWETICQSEFLHFFVLLAAKIQSNWTTTTLNHTCFCCKKVTSCEPASCNVWA